MQFMSDDTVQMKQLTKRFTGQSYHWLVNDASPAPLFSRAYTVWTLGLSFYKDSDVSFDHPYPPRWRNIMPRAKQTKTEQKPATSGFLGFVNIKLSDDEFDIVDGIVPTMDVGETLKWCADFGKVTVSYNAQNNTYNCSVTFSGGRLDKRAISSFSDNPIEALAITCYKIEQYHDTVDLSGSTAGKARRG